MKYKSKIEIPFYRQDSENCPSFSLTQIHFQVLISSSFPDCVACTVLKLYPYPYLTLESWDQIIMLWSHVFARHDIKLMIYIKIISAQHLGFHQRIKLKRFFSIFDNETCFLLFFLTILSVGLFLGRI